MLNYSTGLSDTAHFHPEGSATPPISMPAFVRKSVARTESLPQQQRIAAKRRSCKTCSGKCCIGRCRF